MDERQHISSLVFKTGETVNIPVYEWLVAERSKYHFIQVARTDLGLTMFVNNIIQSAEGDNGAYEQCMLKPLRSSDREILIIGGGDGKLAAMASALNVFANITVVDIDERIVDICRTHFGQKVFFSPNVKLHIADALNFLARQLAENKKFDGALIDLTDDPIRKEDMQFEAFHTRLIELIHRRLHPEGWVAIQGGTEDVCDSFLDSKTVLREILNPHFELVETFVTDIPSFAPDRAAFLYGLHPFPL